MPTTSDGPTFFHISTSEELAVIESRRMIPRSNRALGNHQRNEVVFLVSDRTPLTEIVRLGWQMLPGGDSGHLVRLRFKHGSIPDLRKDKSFDGFHDVWVLSQDIDLLASDSVDVDYIGRLRTRESAPTEQQLCSVIIEWAARHPEILRVWLYGSRVRTDFKPESDWDVAVELSGGSSGWIALPDNWITELERPLGWKIDAQPISKVEGSKVHGGVKRDGRLAYGRGKEPLA
jgi:predicted nucleotidyltransferase